MASPLSDADVAKYVGLFRDAKSKVTALRAWKDKADGSPDDFDRELGEALGFSKAAFGIFRDDVQFER